MANFVLLQIDTSIALFSSLVQNGANTPRYQRNLQWLQRLRARAAAKMEEASQQQGSSVTKATGTTPDMLSGSAAAGQDDRDVELIGWRTRLIRQADQQQQQQQQHTTQQTIINGSSNGTMNGISNYSNLNTNTNNNGSYNQYSNHYSGGSSYGTAMATTDETPPSMAGSIIMPAMAGQVTLQSTDDVLREFWDPIMLHNLLEGGNDASDATQQFTVSYICRLLLHHLCCSRSFLPFIFHHLPSFPTPQLLLTDATNLVPHEQRALVVGVGLRPFRLIVAVCGRPVRLV